MFQRLWGKWASPSGRKPFTGAAVVNLASNRPIRVPGLVKRGGMEGSNSGDNRVRKPTDLETDANVLTEVEITPWYLAWAAMEGMADERMFQLVTELCANVPGLKAREDKTSFVVVKEEAQDYEEPFEMDSSNSFDKVLASLFDMGFAIEDASKAIRDCGRLDVAAAIEHMNAETPATTAVATDSSLVAPIMCKEALPAPRMKVKVEEEEQHVSNAGTRVSCPRVSTFEASTSSAHVVPQAQDDVKEQDNLALYERSLSPSKALCTFKGKLPMTATVEGHDHHVDSNRWEYDDDDRKTDKKHYLKNHMGFSGKEVTDAIHACGEDTDVNELANYIMNNMVDLVEEDYDLVGEDLIYTEGTKEFELENSKDWPSEELKDKGLLILSNLNSMGFHSFSPKTVVDAIHACGKDAADETLVDYLLDSSEKKGDTPQNLSKLEQLKSLGCTSTAACLRAIDNNRDASVGELFDYVRAEELSDEFEREDGAKGGLKSDLQRKRKAYSSRLSCPSKAAFKQLQKKFKKVECFEEDVEEDDSPEYFHNRKGFGLPGEPVIPRVLSEEISRPPYFYFENVASMPKDEWTNIQRHLYEIAPEFVDSLNFSPCRRPRGYIHNLPLEGRSDVLPRPPMTVQELIPGSAGFWPAWDKRTKLNTINTRMATDFVRRKIQESVTAFEQGELSSRDTENIMHWSKKWNLVWIRPGVLAPLCPEEIETCLGFDQNHTRVLYSTVDRVRVLGNSFQVNTVAFHLSVLRSMYSSGIRVLSLFSGIGGAEVALHKLGIFLKVVVSVEIDDKARMVVDSWWKTTQQKGRLIHTFWDVKDLDSKAIQGLVDQFGGFDLVIGGSPCNNLSGNNRCTRTGLAGPASITFFEFPRILDEVRKYMAQRRR